MADKKAQRTQEEKEMNRMRRASMMTLEDAYAEPPPYSSQPPSVQASAANVTAGDAPTREIPIIEKQHFTPSPLEIPNPAECMTHLKLLHAFAKLRHDVGNHEGLFGITQGKAKGEKHARTQESELLRSHESDQPEGSHVQDPARAAAEAHVTESTADSDVTLAEQIRDKRWSVFVAKAVDRYEAWWDSLPASYPHSSSVWRYPISTKAFDSVETDLIYTHSLLYTHSVARFPTEGEGFEQSTKFSLPPLDVLMVWHAHMLNPRIYLEDCIRYTKHRLWRTCFPWQTIYEAIDNETLDYDPKDSYTFQNGHPWDPLQDDSLKKITCQECLSAVRVPWTRPSESSEPGALEQYLTSDTGFSGPAFQEDCPQCGFTFTHEKLRVGKFIDDASDLLEKHRPLPGTILDNLGKPGCTTLGKRIGTHDAFFPNRVISTRPAFRPASLRKDMRILTVGVLKNRFQELMETPLQITYVNSQQFHPEFIAKESLIAVRRMLSHYWDNSSIFGIDLAGAVLRQGTFVQKMKKLDWLHSPSIMSTVQRLIVKYHRFVRLAAESPKRTVVPTLDIDLAWHTHQLTPKLYYRYTLAETKKFLNHDDKIPEHSLHTAFQKTSLAYEKKYSQPYSECSCWYCECTREPLRSNFLNKFSPRRSSLSVDKLHEKGFTKNPHMGPHVSAHNALVIDSAKAAQERRNELEELDLQYAKVVKRYQKQNNKKKKAAETPSRDSNDAYLYGAYGFPMYYPMPIYVPYYADPSVAQDQSAHTGGEAGGSCVAGSCAASTSLGACAGGDGTPGCKASCGAHGDAGGGCGTCESGGGDGGGDGGCGGCGG